MVNFHFLLFHFLSRKWKWCALPHLFLPLPFKPVMVREEVEVVEVDLVDRELLG